MRGVVLDDRVLKQLIRVLPGRMDSLIGEATGEIAAEIVERLGGPSPSAPGEPPGEDTGELRANISSTKVAEHEYMVYSPTEYAPHLEFGTEKMDKRPFFTPIIEDWRARKLIEFVKLANLFEP